MMPSSVIIHPETCFMAKCVHSATVRFGVSSKATTSDFTIPQQRGKKNISGHFSWLLSSSTEWPGGN